ncbi:electron transporter SenC [Erythrobacter sp. SG61-1L]|nr:electron transporter SenC [Erythrobacter sp. SG61-1L]
MVLWLAVALAGCLALAAWFGSGHKAPEPAAYGDSVGGPFTLVAPDGSTVTQKDFAGKPYAIFFGFTRCPDVCPTTLARMARLRQQLGADGDKFRIVFVSVDPERDKPADIGAYVDLFGTSIVGLTGSDEQIAAIVKAWHVFYDKVPQPGGDYTIDHTASVFLMDRDGKLQSIIDHHETEAASLAKLQRLVS